MILIWHQDELKKQGSHWFVCCNLDLNEDEIEIFDSLGSTASFVSSLNLKTNNPDPIFTFNENPVMPASSKLCGPYSIYFTYCRCTNPDLDFYDILSEYFEENIAKNDGIVQKFMRTGHVKEF